MLTNSTQVNEAGISDLAALLRAVKDGYNTVDGAIGTGRSGYGSGSSRSRDVYTSVAQRASELVAVFPILCSRTVSAKTAQSMAKFVQYKSAQNMIVAISQQRIAGVEDGIQYLRKFHQNIKFGGSDIDSYAKAIDDWVNSEMNEVAAGFADEKEYNDYLLEQEFGFLQESRKDLPDSEFGIPSKRKYPLHDKKHVKLAIIMFNHVDKEDEKTLASNIIKKIKEYNMASEIHVTPKNRFFPYWEKSGLQTQAEETLFYPDQFEVSASALNEIMRKLEESNEFDLFDSQLNPISLNDYMVNESGLGKYTVKLSVVSEASGKSSRDKMYDAYTQSIKEKDARKNDYYKHRIEEEKKDRENKRYIEREKQKTESEIRRDNARQDQAVKDANAKMNAQRKQADWERKNREKQEDREYNINRRNKTDRERDEDRQYNLNKRAKMDREHDEDREYNLKKRSRLDNRQDLDDNLSRRSNDRADAINNIDIKNINNANPFLLKVTFHQSQHSNVATDFIIGVKAKLLAVDSNEIIRRIVNDNNDGKFFVNMLRVMTGEKGFWNTVLALDAIDDDIAANRKSGAQGTVWTMLRNRAWATKEAVRRHKPEAAMAAITTVLMTQDDADSLLKEENIDITNPKIARRFMESYNLYGFIIVNDATESVKVMWDDGDKFFDELAYRTVSNEVPDDYKKVIQLMNKLG